ncbi:MAG: protease HtpX [Epsilonproteobacteria bacterium]|nr:MAG: protease HtpX [Campylobacterota bacterium]
MFKRLFLFLTVNILVMIAGSFLISVVLNLLGLGPALTAQGINYTSLMVICFVWGMAGSFISLRLSRWIAKRAYGVEIQSPTGRHGQMVMKVHQLAKAAGITTMPEVGIYEANEINAFATGHAKNSSLVAVSSGLLQQMGSDETEAILAHEISHIANGDMVTMALVQGVVNAFVMFFAQLATIALDNVMRGDNDNGRGMGFFMRHMVYMFFTVIFGILASPIVMGFSRWREYHADAGSAKLAGKDKMIRALEALERNYPQLSKAESNQAAFQISAKDGWMELFASHPPLKKRIAALKAL